MKGTIKAIDKFGISVKMLRIKHGLSREALSEETGISSRTIMRIETGKTSLKLPDLFLLAEAMYVSPSEFFVEANINWQFLRDEHEAEKAEQKALKSEKENADENKKDVTSKKGDKGKFFDH